MSGKRFTQRGSGVTRIFGPRGFCGVSGLALPLLNPVFTRLSMSWQVRSKKNLAGWDEAGRSRSAAN